MIVYSLGSLDVLSLLSASILPGLHANIAVLADSGIWCPNYVGKTIGLVRLTVGQKRNDGAKVQYCITAIEVP